VLDEAVDFVALPMFDGELGVPTGARPLIVRSAMATCAPPRNDSKALLRRRRFRAGA